MRCCAETRNHAGFTLLELLIVVAIIGVLVAIAIPNFFAAQIRARVARVQEEFYMLNLALEVFYIDFDYYPPTRRDDDYHLESRFAYLTTPVSYISSPSQDPFTRAYDNGAAIIPLAGRSGARGYVYTRSDTAGRRGAIDLSRDFFMLASGGPDRVLRQIFYYPPHHDDPEFPCPVCDSALRSQLEVVVYDPTNGIVSAGDLYRWNGI